MKQLLFGENGFFTWILYIVSATVLLLLVGGMLWVGFLGPLIEQLMLDPFLLLEKAVCLTVSFTGFFYLCANGRTGKRDNIILATVITVLAVIGCFSLGFSPFPGYSEDGPIHP